MVRHKDKSSPEPMVSCVSLSIRSLTNSPTTRTGSSLLHARYSSRRRLQFGSIPSKGVTRTSAWSSLATAKFWHALSRLRNTSTAAVGERPEKNVAFTFRNALSKANGGLHKRQKVALLEYRGSNRQYMYQVVTMEKVYCFWIGLWVRDKRRSSSRLAGEGVRPLNWP